MTPVEEIRRALVDVEVDTASRRMYMVASELEVAAGYMSEDDPLRAYLRRRAEQLRTVADHLTEGTAEAWGALT